MAIPKGSLEEATFALLGKAWTRVCVKIVKNRTYRVFLDDSEIIVKMLRPQADTNNGGRRFVDRIGI